MKALPIKHARERHLAVSASLLSASLTKGFDWLRGQTHKHWFPVEHQRIVAGMNGDLAGMNPGLAVDLVTVTATAQELPLVTGAMLQKAWLDVQVSQAMTDKNPDLVTALVKQFQEEAQPQEQQNALQLLHVSSLEVTAPKWLVRDYFEADSLGLLFGDPECGKSFMGIHLSCCVATGTEFFGQSVDQGAAVYICGEGQNGIARRFNAWAIRNQMSLADYPLYVTTRPADMTGLDAELEMVKAIEQAVQGQAVKLVVVDTLARNFGIGDENSTRDMSAFVRTADAIKNRFGATVLLIHHTGHNHKDRARGAFCLKGALDAEYRMDRDLEDVVRFESCKMKDAPRPEPLAFVMRSVELGFEDDQGRQVTSAILDRTEYAPPTKQTSQSQGKWQTVALDLLDTLTEKQRQNLLYGGYDPDSARVSEKDWRDACRASMTRQNFYDAKKSLMKNGEIVIQSGYVTVRSPSF